jgi:hypothetical protein
MVLNMFKQRAQSDMRNNIANMTLWRVYVVTMGRKILCKDSVRVSVPRARSHCH